MNPFTRTPTRLKILAYNDRSRLDKIGYVEAMYNPDSILLNCHTQYMPDDFINTNQQSSRYVQTLPAEISLELLFDAQMPGNRRPINEQIAELQALCYDVNPAKGEPRFLKLEWGTMRWMTDYSFNGRLTQFQVRYTLFNKGGEPLRATVTLGLIADKCLSQQKAIQEQAAPGNMVVTMPDATSLPALVNSVTNSSVNDKGYLAIAMDNGMDSLDAARPGDLITFTKSETLENMLTHAQAGVVEPWVHHL